MLDSAVDGYLQRGVQGGFDTSPEKQNMLWKTFLSVMVTVFLAEIGDKTQLATMLFAADVNRSKWAVFLGSATALILASGMGVLAGSQLDRFISPSTLRWLAGFGFIAVGIWTLVSK